MIAFNILRCRVKPGREQEFLDAHRDVATHWPRRIRVSIVDIGDGGYCLIGEWESREALAAARPAMIATPTPSAKRSMISAWGSG